MGKLAIEGKPRSGAHAAGGGAGAGGGGAYGGQPPSRSSSKAAAQTAAISAAPIPPVGDRLALLRRPRSVS